LRGRPNFSRPSPRRAGFPRRGRLWRQRFQHCLPKTDHLIAVGLSYPGFRRDHRENADDLRLRRQPVGIEPIGRPGQVFMYAVEAEPEMSTVDTLGPDFGDRSERE
jgi:hypothetical protein